MGMSLQEERSYKIVSDCGESIAELLRDFPECSVKEELRNILHATNECKTEMLIVTGEG